MTRVYEAASARITITASSKSFHCLRLSASLNPLVTAPLGGYKIIIVAAFIWQVRQTDAAYWQ